MGTVLNPADVRSAYIQIADELRDAIRREEYKPGQALPSERELVDAYGVTRPTIRDAVQLLEQEGLLDVVKGIGRFVRVRARLTTRRVERLSSAERSAGRGLSITDLAGGHVQVAKLRVQPQQASTETAELLRIRPGDEVLGRWHQARIDGEPVAAWQVWVPLRMAEGTELTVSEPITDDRWWDVIEQAAGARIAYFTEHVTTRPPTPDERFVLEIPGGLGIGLFRLIQTAHDADDRVLMVDDGLLRGDRYALEYRIPVR